MVHEALLGSAFAFLEAFHAETGRRGLSERIEEVRAEVIGTGGYTHTSEELARIIHDAHGVVISPVSGSPAGCARAGGHAGASAGSMVRIAGFGIAVEGLDRGDAAPRFR